MAKAWGFADEESFRRVREATRRVLGTPRKGAQQRRQVPIVGGGCANRNEVWKFIIGGSPDGGSFTFDLNVLGTTEEMEFSWNDSDTDIETELETHTNISSGDVNVTGGPFPDTDMTIEFQGDLAEHLMDPPTTIDFSGLTGGTGTVVVFVAVRPGHPRDGGTS